MKKLFALLTVTTAVLTACPAATPAQIPDTAQPSVSRFANTGAKLEVRASDSGGIAKVEFWRVGAASIAANPTAPTPDQLLATDTVAPYEYTLTTQDSGAFSFYAKVFDTSGNSTQTQTVDATATPSDQTPPGVPVMTLNKTLFEEREVLLANVSATDNIGVTRVALVLAGYGELQSDDSAPYSLSETLVCTSATPAASAPRRTEAKTLTAVAYDAAGNYTSSVEQTVTINCGVSTPEK